MTSRHLHPVMAASFVLALFSPLAAASSPEQIFAQVSLSVVVVDIIDAIGKSIGLGSGVVTGAGQVITNCHVAQKGENLQVRQSGKTFKASLQFADSDRDLCQLSVPDLQVHPIILGTAKKLKVGQRVYAIGAPQGLELTLSEGLVSSLREYEGSQYIQTSAAISPGSSGGGLFDDQGRLIGITTFYLAGGQNLNFALPVDWIGEVPKRAQVTLVAKKSGLDWLNRIVALEEKKDWEAMLKLAQQWVRSDPNLTAWYYLGTAHDHLKQYDQAIQAYRETLRIDPEYYAFWFELGRAYGNLKQYDEAIKAFRETVRLKPDLVEAWDNLGLAYNNLGQYEQAIKSYREMLRIQPDNAEAWDGLGHAYLGSEQYDQAIKAYREALRIQPDNTSTWYLLAMAHKDFKQYNQAIVAYREVLRIQPNNAGAWYGLGTSYGMLKEYDQAVQSLREALRIQPDDAEAWYILGLTYFLQGQRGKVREIYHILRKRDPAMADKYFNAFVLP